MDNNENQNGMLNGVPNGAPNGAPYGTPSGIPNGAPYGMPNGPQLEKPLSLGEWLITMIVLAIPCVGIVMMFVWSFGQGGSVNRKNYCRAMLILTAICIVLGVIFYGVIFATLATSFRSLY